MRASLFVQSPPIQRMQAFVAASTRPSTLRNRPDYREPQFQRVHAKAWLQCGDPCDQDLLWPNCWRTGSRNTRWQMPQIQTNSSVPPESSAHERPKAAWASALPRWRPDPEAAEAEKHACETNPEKPWGQPPQDFQNPQSSRRKEFQAHASSSSTGTGNPRTGRWRMFRNPTANRFVQEALLKSCTSLETRNTLCISVIWGGEGWGGVGQ